MQRADRHRERHQPQQLPAAGLQKDAVGQPLGAGIEDDGADAGQGKGEKKAGLQRRLRRIRAGGLAPLRKGALSRYIAGDRRLDGAAAQGKTDAEHRENQLIHAHPLCADLLGQKDSVKKADNAAQKSCQRQDKRAGQDRIFLKAKEGRGHGPPLVSAELIYSMKESRTDMTRRLTVSAITGKIRIEHGHTQ